jgi:putative intracellular protease/amidase
LDPSSIDAAKDDKEATEFLHTKDALWANTIPLSSVIDKASEFAAVYFVGGHGPMFDLAKSSESAQLVKNFDAAGKVVAAVCHGPAALTHPDLADFLKGENVTGFSNSEENAVEMSDKVPFLLEDRLKEMGTKYSKGDDWSDYVVVSKGGRLVTGQNPASAAGVAKKVLEKVQG